MAITEHIERELRDANRELMEENRRLKAELAALKGGDTLARVSREEIASRAERLSLIIESTQVGTWDWDPITDFVTWNEYAFAMFGLEPQDAPTSFARAAERIHPEDVPQIRLALKKHLGRGESFGMDIRARRGDGTYRWVHCCGRAMRDSKGRPQGVIGLLIDVDERKRAEIGALGQVTVRERELQLARQELEEFCYAVAHDLRTPLRSIHGFSRAIETEYGHKLDAVGLEYLQRVQKASVTLADLLDSLLGMVRISRVEVHPDAVDLTALVRSVAADFAEADPSRNVDLQVQEGMKTQGDPRLLRLLVTNLLSNAFKFTCNTPHARIEAGCKDGIFYIRDNGAGYDMQYSDKLYKPFQKLHPSARFPGTGIGLTIAQRIALRHGGSVWGESAGENQGATFYFKLS